MIMPAQCHRRNMIMPAQRRHRNDHASSRRTRANWYAGHAGDPLCLVVSKAAPSNNYFGGYLKRVQSVLAILSLRKLLWNIRSLHYRLALEGLTVEYINRTGLKPRSNPLLKTPA
jgi:hypothetical protein